MTPTPPDKDEFTQERSRDALHSYVRRLCGNKDVKKCVLLEDAALIEYPKGIILVTLVKDQIKSLTLTDAQAAMFATELNMIYDDA